MDLQSLTVWQSNIYDKMEPQTWYGRNDLLKLSGLASSTLDYVLQDLVSSGRIVEGERGVNRIYRINQ